MKVIEKSKIFDVFLMDFFENTRPKMSNMHSAAHNVASVGNKSGARSFGKIGISQHIVKKI